MKLQFKFEEISNYYGCLCFFTHDNRFYWGIENYTWEDECKPESIEQLNEISKDAFDFMIKYHESKIRKDYLEGDKND